MDGVRRGVVIASLIACCAVTAAASDTPASSPAGAPVELECTPVDTWWPVSSPGRVELGAPRLSVVAIDLRPNSTIVLLDGRIVGRSKHFNGRKGFLYLEPGRYALELQLDGYRPETFQIQARPGCRFDLRHRMVRDRDAETDPSLSGVGKGTPVQWVWGPVGAAGAAPQPARTARHGPDLRLRPDLSDRTTTATGTAEELGSLRLRVEPDTASIFLDGVLLATARELELMVAPLAVPAGAHLLEVRAPGHTGSSQEIAVAAGEVTELTISLERDGSPASPGNS